MPVKRFITAVAVLALGTLSGCCAWCDRHCPNRQPVAVADEEIRLGMRGRMPKIERQLATDRHRHEWFVQPHRAVS